ncbi:casein kinase ii subunit beta [Anaeramoeba flamelloides]|uniref:Casein kinase II subunit beta n=1 Tax=Anaeramoeba flamelloides TaxID=1746091 RepID=A0AAV8AFE4_9EUKA|nr:casein kinase ii subunit beta [Anaeramoeba flamelloides]
MYPQKKKSKNNSESGSSIQTESGSDSRSESSYDSEEDSKTGSESESNSDSETENSSESDVIGWPEWFCDLEGNEWFVEIHDDYLMDDFNFYGLSKYIPHYHLALDTIRDIDNEESQLLSKKDKETLDKEAGLLYGLIHARYIITRRGMKDMIKKIKYYTFGKCIRYQCKNKFLIPIGLHDVPGKNSVKVYCPNCQKIYHAPKYVSSIDGAFFGTTFPHFFLSTFPQFKPKHVKETAFVPKIFGFEIHSSVPKYYIKEKITSINNINEKKTFEEQIQIENEK